MEDQFNIDNKEYKKRIKKPIRKIKPLEIIQGTSIQLPLVTRPEGTEGINDGSGGLEKNLGKFRPEIRLSIEARRRKEELKKVAEETETDQFDLTAENPINPIRPRYAEIVTSEEGRVATAAMAYGGRSAKDYDGLGWSSAPDNESDVFQFPYIKSHNVIIKDSDDMSLSESRAFRKMIGTEESLCLHYVFTCLKLAQVENGGLPYIDFILLDCVKAMGLPWERPEERKTSLDIVWRTLLIGERLVVKGIRKIPYSLDGKKQEISMDEAPFYFMGRGYSEDLEIPGFKKHEYPPPAIQGIVCSPGWVPVLRNTAISQWMPLGEMLRRIRGGTIPGSIARTIGVYCANEWRMRHIPKLSVAKIFEHSPPAKLREIQALRYSKNSERLIGYFSKAIKELVNHKVLAEHPDGDIEKLKERLHNGKAIGQTLCDALFTLPVPLLKPSAKVAIHLEEIASRRTALEPVQTIKRPGRPKTGS